MPPANCTIINAEQRSEAWKLARIGRVTGSRAHDALAKTKAGQWTAERKNLRLQLVLERITGQPQEPKRGGYQIADGIAREPQARHAYEVATGTIVRECGFISDNTFLIGCSPDGYLGDFEGLISIKCPLAATHLETLTAIRSRRDKLAEAAETDPIIDTNSALGRLHLDIVGDEYLNQIRHELLITDAQWCDYVSYHPTFPPKLRLAIVRVTREDVDLNTYGPLLHAFLAEVEVDYQKVMAMAA